ncbi:MAG: hypothetical protein FD151_448, partial [bacterium]
GDKAEKISRYLRKVFFFDFTARALCCYLKGEAVSEITAMRDG